jgi:hypothetical protein
MVKDKFTFGSTSQMREVPPGESAVISFTGKMEEVETEWGQKYSFEVTLYSHPSYPNLDPIRPLETIWQSKSQCAQQLLTAASQGLDDLTKALKEKWKLIRSEEGTYFIEQI